LRFEWDAAKAESNLRKHGLGFDTAILVFADPLALTEQDRIEDCEYRWQTRGFVGETTLLLVAHTYQEEDGDVVIRIISARKATRKEKRRYEQNR
jgi:uncharacterized DUF497 family protein